MSKTRLRGNAPRRKEPYPLGEIPDDVIVGIGRECVARIAIGSTDLTGDDFGDAFAEAVGGEHRSSPLGIADVTQTEVAWSVKTVKAKSPRNQKRVRLISGRNSPDYSMGMTDLHADPQKTGNAVLRIWNERVNEALHEFRDLRVVVLLRNFEERQFRIFEEEARRYTTAEYTWTFNKNNNLEGREKLTGAHRFTWQFHGSQFTVIREVPSSARNFAIRADIPHIETDRLLDEIGFKEEWIELE